MDTFYGFTDKQKLLIIPVPQRYAQLKIETLFEVYEEKFFVTLLYKDEYLAFKSGNVMVVYVKIA